MRVYRQPLEHLLRYCARHKAANWIGRGRGRKSTRPGANGVVALTPFEFLNRVADLVPPPRKQIAQFCSTKYRVTFPMFSKITFKDAGKAPLYKALTEAADPQGEVGWNFEKFLIGKDGTVIGRFKSGVAPDDAKLAKAIEAALAK